MRDGVQMSGWPKKREYVSTIQKKSYGLILAYNHFQDKIYSFHVQGIWNGSHHLPEAFSVFLYYAIVSLYLWMHFMSY